MRKLSFVFCLFVLILAPASSFATSNNPLISANETIDNEGDTNESFHLSPVGFDKILTVLIVEGEPSDIKLEILDKSSHIKYAAQYSFANAEWAEVDLSLLAGGTYTIKLTSGNHTQVESIILP